MAEQINITPMVTHALVKSPTPVDENGRTLVEIELRAPHGFERAGFDYPPQTGDTVTVRLFFKRKAP